MDLDIDMGDTHDPSHEEVVLDIPLGDDILQTGEPEEDGEVVDDQPPDENDTDESRKIVPHKVHISGVDTLHTDDIRSYVKSHSSGLERVEWIDDSAANLIFPSESSARDALQALSTIEVADVTALSAGETLPAKSIDGKPDVALSVRMAVVSDKKAAGAALRSRYYLMHPEHDPEEKRRRQQDNRNRYRERDWDSRNGRGRRRSDDEVETFEASMYDDVPRSDRHRRDSRSASRTRLARRLENRGKELFADKSTGRNRSASPRKDVEGDEDMDYLANSNSRNRREARDLKDRISGHKAGRELFPASASGRGGVRLDAMEESRGSASLKEDDRPKIIEGGGSFNIRGMASKTSGADNGFSIKGAANARELFPGRLDGGSSSNKGKELFGNRRRQKAEDLFG